MPDPSKKVTEVMSTVLWTLTPDTGVASACRLAESEGVRHFLVLDNGTLTGAVSAKTLRSSRSTKVVGEVMTSPVLCIGPDETIGEALQIMEENFVSFLPIVGYDVIVGNVTDSILRGVKEVEPTEPRRSRLSEA